MNGYSWEVNSLVIEPGTAETLENVICRAVATYKVTDQDGKTAGRLLNVAMGPADPLSFTDFAQVTQTQVVGWIEAILGAQEVTNLQAALDDVLIEQTYIPMQPPWLAE